MKKKLLIGYIFGIHLLLLIMLLKYDFISYVGYRVGLIRYPEITKNFELMLEYHERMDPNVPDGAAIFIGDSITQDLLVSAVTASSVNYGMSGDTTVGVLKRLPKYHSLERARVCVLAIGVNDLRYRSNEEILKNYSLIIREVPQHVPVVISAVLPVDERVRDDLAGWNMRIRALDRGLKVLCESQGPKCTFLDPSSKLIDTSGNLRKECHDSKGVHLSAEGNAIWIKVLKEIINKTLQSHARDRVIALGDI